MIDATDVDDVYFQQDARTYHTAQKTITLLREKCAGRVISQNGDIEWSPRSCDLTPFSLWGYIKDNGYIKATATVQVLKVNIRSVIHEILFIYLYP